MFARRLFRLSSALTRCKRHCMFGPPDGSAWEPETKLTLLDNGIRVVTEESNSPLATVALCVEAGPRFETAANNGITHVIEHLAYKGFRSMNRCCVEETALYSPMRFTASTTQELQWFHVTCPVNCVPQATTMICQIIWDLLATDCELDCERKNISLEMIDADADPRAFVFENVIQTAFQGTSMGQPVIGPSCNIEKFNGRDIQRFMADHYQPWRFVFATSGCICHDVMVANITKNLGCRPASSCPPDYGAARFTGSEINYRDDSQKFAHICIALEAPGFTSADYMFMRVAKNVIGSWYKGQSVFGTWPELAKRCVDTELCESYESFYITYRDVGLWGIYFVCKPMAIEDMIYNVQNVWLNLCTTTVFSDFDRAMRKLKVELALERDGSFKSTIDMATEVMYRCERPYLRDHDYKMYTMKVDKMVETAENYVYDRCPAVAAYGPTEGLPEYNRLRAGMYWLRL